VLSDEFVEDRGELMQPTEVGLGQPADYAVTGLGQPDADHAAVVAIRYPLGQPGRLGPVDELHRAVRPQQQVAGEVAHGRRPIPRVPLDRYQQLVLYVGKTRRSGLVLAPALELAQRDPELQQPLEIPPGHLGHRHLQHLWACRARHAISTLYRRAMTPVMRTRPAHGQAAAGPAGRWHTS
jgi:hypothetical protein